MKKFKDFDFREGSALIVVAHPDDETIWMGGVLSKFKNVKWTIFSLCRGSDPDRKPRFKKACKIYRAKGIISDLEDEGIMNISQSVPKIAKILKANLQQKNFTYIFTHGYNGEYGHPRHKGVHRAVKDLIRSGYLKAANLYAFSYRLNEKIKTAVPKRQSKFIFRLPEKIFLTKKSIIEKTYNFSPKSFESKSCSKTETFDLLN